MIMINSNQLPVWTSLDFLTSGDMNNITLKKKKKLFLFFLNASIKYRPLMWNCMDHISLRNYSNSHNNHLLMVFYEMANGC